MYAINLFQNIGLSEPDKFNGYLLFGYFVMFGIMMVYLVYLWSRQQNAKKDLEMMQRLLNEEQG